jgi:hypothetical protein
LIFFNVISAIFGFLRHHRSNAALAEGSFLLPIRAGFTMYQARRSTKAVRK